MLPSPRFSVASAFVPHLCFLSLLCFLSDFPVFPDPPVRTKTFFAHDKPKTTMTCAENVLTLTPECFHHHVFCCLCIRPSSLLSLFTLLRPHSTRPISLSLFSVISIDPFSLFARSPLLFCFSDFPHLLCYLCFFRISLFSLRPLSLCFLSLLCFFSDFPISPDPPVRAKTFSAHNKPKNNHDVRGKRFNAHAGPR